MPEYMNHIQGKQEVMVGYSDSAKDAGRLAASWAQYKCQEEMVKIGENHKVELTFFHGKGGTVGRGGNPALYHAILAHPPNTINGRFRITEQGEMITQNFGQAGIAERTLDLFTAGVLAEKFEKRMEPKDEWRDAMEFDGLGSRWDRPSLRHLRRILIACWYPPLPDDEEWCFLKYSGGE